MLRPYQENAYNAIVSNIKRSTESVLVEAVTAAGKSHIIAAVAKFISSNTDKQILCIAPSKELIEQNHSKYIALGENASFYSASVDKCLRYPVIFGTPMSIKNSLDKFIGKVSAVIIDECHNIGNTIKDIVKELKQTNGNLRVIGFTATPYRTGQGYIFNQWPTGDKNTSDDAVNPYFDKLVDRITAYELIDQKYLTPPLIGTTDDHYDTSGLTINKMGKFDSKAVDHAFVGHGRLTSMIVADIVNQSKDRNGVMLFCATIQHAEEALASLPVELSRLVTGKTKKEEREIILKEFKDRKIKYLVNVAVLTTGFDAPHVDVIAMLRATESPGLMQQIIGRGLRIHPDKKDCLILDYAENIERHCPDGDVFNPELTINRSSNKDGLQVICPDCGGINYFIPDDDIDNLQYNQFGYMVDLEGNEIIDDSGNRLAVHKGRRCQNNIKVKEEYKRCDYRWNFKECPECNHQNDIAARHCSKCKSELVDPNEKLVLDFKKIKQNPYVMQTDKILTVSAYETISRQGNDMIVIDWMTEYRKFTSYHTPAYKSKWSAVFKDNDIKTVVDVINSGRLKTVSYKKQQSGYYEIYGFNQPEDKTLERKLLKVGDCFIDLEMKNRCKVSKTETNRFTAINDGDISLNKSYPHVFYYDSEGIKWKRI